MKTKRNKTTRILIIIFAVALLIEIGYALLSSNLKINGNTKINQARWDVHFENVQVTEGSVTPTTPAAIAEGDNTTVNYEVTLKNPGDFYEFTVDAVNSGTIDAMIAKIVSTPTLTEAQQKYLAYTVSYESGAAIEAKQLLAANKTEKLKVRVEFKEDIIAADLPTAAVDLTLTFSVEYVQADSTTVAIAHPVCKRATTLHTINSVDYGNLKSKIGGSRRAGDDPAGLVIPFLVAGEALDCDVNGDGTYDSVTERFYYISDLESDSNYAVLAYYSNVAAGLPNNTAMFVYDSDNTPRANGPKTAIAELPTTEQWPKVSLTSTTRAIKDETGTIHKTGFSYAGKAARLLTTKEVESACKITAEGGATGELDSCKYLMENTYYSDHSLNQYGYWLESVHSSNASIAWCLDGSSRTICAIDANSEGLIGVRPVIEVPKSKIAS